MKAARSDSGSLGERGREAYSVRTTFLLILFAPLSSA